MCDLPLSSLCNTYILNIPSGIMSFSERKEGDRRKGSCKFYEGKVKVPAMP